MCAETTDLVVDDLYRIVLNLARLDLVCNSAGVCKGRYCFANLVEGEDEVVWHSPSKLLFRLVSEHYDGYVGGALSLRKRLLRHLRDRGVDTTAQSTVGADHDPEGLFTRLGRLGYLGLVEDLDVGGSVLLCDSHGCTMEGKSHEP